MGGRSGTPYAQRTSDVLQDYTRFLPALMSATSAEQPAVAQGQLASTIATQPLYNALNLNQAQQYSLPLAKVGQEVTNSNALAGAQTNVNQLQGAGGRAALTATALNRAANPGYYQAQDAASRGAAAGVNAINMNGLSPGEQNSVERSLNQTMGQTGNLGLTNPMNTVANAMNFGGAFNNKIGILGNATNVASNAAQSASGNGGLNATNVALGQPNVSASGNFGTGTFTNTNANTQNQSGQNAFGFGNGAMGNMTSSNNALIGANASIANANSIPAYMSGAGSILGSC
jgi:hypothetical protein